MFFDRDLQLICIFQKGHAISPSDEMVGSSKHSLLVVFCDFLLVMMVFNILLVAKPKRNKSKFKNPRGIPTSQRILVYRPNTRRICFDGGEKGKNNSKGMKKKKESV